MNLFVIFQKNKSMVPFASLILFLIFVCVDIWTTYLASPDLKLEGNLVIQYFNLGWRGLILYNIVIFAIIIILFYFSVQYISNYLKSKQSKTILKTIIFCFFCFGIICFYSTIVGACLASISNYFVYLNLYSKAA